MESNHRKAVPGAGWGRGYFFTLDSTQQYIRSRGTLSSAAYQSGSSSYVVAVNTFFTAEKRTLLGIMSSCGSCGLLRLNHARIFSLRLVGDSYYAPMNVKVLTFCVFRFAIIQYIFTGFIIGDILFFIFRKTGYIVFHVLVFNVSHSAGLEVFHTLHLQCYSWHAIT